jgi:NAD+ synthase
LALNESLVYGLSAPGARLTNKAFWLDRRYPMVNRWRDPS